MLYDTIIRGPAGVGHYCCAVLPAGLFDGYRLIGGRPSYAGIAAVPATGMEEAIEIASMHPAARLGEQHGFGIEVRPLEPEISTL